MLRRFTSLGSTFIEGSSEAFQLTAVQGLKAEDVAGAPDLWSGLREHLASEPLAEASSGPTNFDLEDLTKLLGPTDDPQMLGRWVVMKSAG
jgi:hypothetical protein